ncbi:MAG: hypothetical protein LBK68_03155 [Candidatus Margulisbacteria bacterium]|jgi:hypothetical protein|nr:hypothetical protein [Candidatus Margulisiibacteriota bacterium]MDR1323417.1 hypothetical protein [Candidatus Margulisiibacteriota bacterium]
MANVNQVTSGNQVLMESAVDSTFNKMKSKLGLSFNTLSQIMNDNLSRKA